jgi:cytochrome P450
MTTATAASTAPAMPGALPGLGHLHRFARDPLAFLTAMGRQGDLVSWRFGPRHAVFLNDPDAIREVFLGVERTFSMSSGTGYAFDLFAGNGIINTTGEVWRRQRAMMQPGMRPRRIAAYASAMVESTEQMLAQWRPGQVRDIRTDMLGLTQRIAARTLFSADVSGDAAAVGRALDVASREIGAEFRGVTMFAPAWVPLPGRRRLRAAIADVEQVLYRIIAGRRASGERAEDMLTLLMDARDEGGRPMSDRQLRDETMTLYIAGHETTGNTLTWAFTLLARNPEVVERIAAEVDDVLGDATPTMEHYRRLPYTEAVIKETLRLYPPAWLLPVTASADAEVAGYAVPAGTEVWMSQWVTHRDPRWFPGPERFRPERFLGEEGAAIPPFAWFPFGGGPHVCMGSRFALLETVLVLALVARRYRMTMHTDAEIAPQPLLTLQPGRDVPVRITARSSQPHSATA